MHVTVQFAGNIFAQPVQYAICLTINYNNLMKLLALVEVNTSQPLTSLYSDYFPQENVFDTQSRITCIH